MDRPIAVPPAPSRKGIPLCVTLATAASFRRRRLLLASPLIFLLPLARAASPLAATPAQMLGPFYPVQPDAAAGNDLGTVDGKLRARGKALTIVGRVADTAGRPLPGVLVEIWQTNAHGRYHHPQDDSPQPLDPNFRGYGRAIAGADGAYRFSTIEPVAYPGRTPHVHFRLSRGARELLVTQMYLPEAAAANARDGLFMSLQDGARRRLVGVPEVGAAGTLRFDIVLG
ncbi:MAG: intradiol ring-cleavage dioxygenase [Rhodocyclales bacterium]|nr:intradiol ring-cleavage dioxygenase [Rhodocyclales bacterium]